MAKIPMWLLGRHVTTVQIYSAGVADDGTLVLTNTGSLVGQLSEIQLSIPVNDENIQAMDVRQANYVIVEDDFQLVLTEILKRNGTNVLVGWMAVLSPVTDYGYIRITRGIDQWEGYFIRGPYEERMNKGKSEAVLTVRSVGASNDDGSPSFNPKIFFGEDADGNTIAVPPA